MKRFNFLKDERGFLLPLAVILVVVLSISGIAFYQLEFGERRMGMNERWSQKAFYLAQSGIERAREAFKIGTEGSSPSWTPVLNGTDADYPVDASPNALLCPDISRGCAVPPFQTISGNPAFITADGQGIAAPDMPFSTMYGPGEYTVRAFNNGGAGDSGVTDGDQMITLRALGNVNGTQKVIQVDIIATSNLGLINCHGMPGDPCPDSVNGDPVVDPMEGREPRSITTMPVLDPPLSSTSNYYRNPAHFPGITKSVEIPAGYTLSDTAGKEKIAVENNTLYYTVTGTAASKISINVDSANNIVIVNANGSIDIDSGHLTNAVVAAANHVNLAGGSKTSVNAALPNPAIIAGGDVTQSASSSSVYGNIYAGGTINLNPITVHGALIGEQVEIQGGAGTEFTDDENPMFYALMPGFSYSEDNKSTVTVADTWREIQ